MVSIANPPNSGKAQGVMGHHLHDLVEGKKRERERGDRAERSEEEGSTRPVATSSSRAAAAVAREHRERTPERDDDRIHKDHARVICGKHE
jgi:hypothetical protein